jgi:hypothetical protein
MATLRKHRGEDTQEILLVGRLNRSEYERHSQTTGVKSLIARARRGWLRRYGSDPAAERLNRR